MSTPLSRRKLLTALSATTLGACATHPAMRASSGQATFVLVPGTWHGGWVWTPLAEQLRAAGARAFPITCTGLGERRHLMSPEIGLATHVDDVVNLIEFEELEQVILVGHSFAGMTITAVADRLRERIAQLVYYDAFIPTPQRPAWVMRDTDGQWPDWWQQRQTKFIDGYQMDFFAEYPIEMLVDPMEHPEIAANVRRRLTRHPAKQWTDPVAFENGGWQGIKRCYIHCVGQKLRPSSAAMYGPAKQAGWRFVEAHTPRLGMLTHVQDTARILLDLA